MTERQEMAAALAEAARVKTHNRAIRDARIRARAAEGMTRREIAKLMGVADSVVDRVVGHIVTKRRGDRGLPLGCP